jgi:CHAT domain-containing protein/Tfp pilus assembly protein PilF
LLLGEKHPDYATSLTNLALLYKAMGDYAKAGPLFRQALAIDKKALGEKHPGYATDLYNLAGLYRATGDYARAGPLYRQARDIRKQALGEKHPDYAQSVSGLAELYKAMGDNARAEPLARQARDLYRQTVGEKHPDYATSLTNLAGLYNALGDYARAEPLLRQALDIDKRALGERHLGYAADLNNLAALYYATGDYARAEPLYRQARDIFKALGEKAPAYATSLNNLAALYQAMGDYARAEPLFRQVRDNRKETLGEDHPYYARSLNNLANLYQAMGDYARAEPLLRQARDVFKALGDKHPDYAMSLNNLAVLYRLMGDYARAEPLYRQALDIRKQALGEKHPDYAASLNNLALLHLANSEGGRGLKLTRQALQITRTQLELTANVQSERQQLRMNEELRFYFDNFLSTAAQAKVPAEEAYAEVLAGKGSVSLRQQQMRRLRRELIAGSPETVRLYADLEAATRRLAALINTAPGPKPLDDYRQQLDEANTEVERRQQDLASASASFRKELRRLRRTPADLRRALPASVALVDLVEYWHFTPQAKGAGTRERRLAAFVVRADRPVEWVDLGPVEMLTEAVEQWRQGLPQRRQPVYGDDDPAVTLRQRLWEPLEAHLQDNATVLISPDGEVSRLPWGALPGATPDKYLIEERAIAVIAVPQLLPELLERDKKADARPPALLLVGDVDYGAAPGRADVEVVSRGLSTVLQRGGGASWMRLEATKQETATIHDAFARSFPVGTAKVLERGGATEAAVREAAPRHAWLHLATHGYFAPEKVNAALERGKKRSEPSLSLAEQRGFVGFPQGLLAGVVLAGANRGGGEGEDDGILTALEVAELDLRGLELAVLSACETGLGVKSGGEGLLGLQRAFQIAGARSVAASLWQVPDEATRALMERFYANLWQKKMGRLEALREAQLWLLNKNAKGKRRTPPLSWAAFVLSGDWR